MTPLKVKGPPTSGLKGQLESPGFFLYTYLGLSPCPGTVADESLYGTPY